MFFSRKMYVPFESEQTESTRTTEPSTSEPTTTMEMTTQSKIKCGNVEKLKCVRTKKLFKMSRGLKPKDKQS